MIVYCPVGRHVGSPARDFFVNLSPKKQVRKNTTYLFPPMLWFPGGIGTALALITGSIFALAYLFLTRTKLTAQYSTTMLVSVVGAVVKSVTGAPLVANYGDPDFAREKGLARTAFRFCEDYVMSRQNAYCVVCVDEIVQKYVLEHFPLRRTLFLPNGGYQAGFSPTDPHSEVVDELRRRLNLTSKKVVLYAGQIEPTYMLNLLAAAAPLTIPAVPDARFVIIGEGASLPELRRVVSSMKLEAYFLFLGPVPYSKLGPYLALSDVCVQLARDWCMGTKVVMYMVHRRPVLAAGSWYKKYGKFLRSRDNCILVPPDRGEVAAALVKLLGDEELRTSLAESAWDTVRPYTWDLHADETLRALHEAMSASRG